jgi:aspartate aminotransferase-like enzyme
VLAVTRERNVLGMVDCISTLGGVPFEFDAWGADVAVSASQKCLMSSPGLAFVAVSPRTWEAYKSARLPRNYWDINEVRKNLGKAQPETPGTAPVHIFLQVEEALRLIHEEGLAKVHARHEDMAAFARARTGALGLEPLCPMLGRQSPTLTALKTPEGIAPKPIRDAMRARGILLAGGLGIYTTTSLRIGHMGDIRGADVDHTCDQLTEVLAELRQPTDAVGVPS